MMIWIEASEYVHMPGLYTSSKADVRHTFKSVIGPFAWLTAIADSFLEALSSLVMKAETQALVGCAFESGLSAHGVAQVYRCRTRNKVDRCAAQVKSIFFRCWPRTETKRPVQHSRQRLCMSPEPRLVAGHWLLPGRWLVRPAKS